MGARFEKADRIVGGCQKHGSGFRCEVAWLTGRNIYGATVSPFYLRRQDTNAWDSHYRIEWAPLKCIESKASNRHCPIQKKRG
jgi:hypothetical protein